MHKETVGRPLSSFAVSWKPLQQTVSDGSPQGRKRNQKKKKVPVLKDSGNLIQQRAESTARLVELQEEENSLHPMVFVEGTLGSISATSKEVENKEPYTFISIGAEIEPPLLPGTSAKQVGVDVQFPWELFPRRLHARDLHLPPFYMDKHLVTNADYANYLRDSGYWPNDDTNFLTDWNIPTATRKATSDCRVVGESTTASTTEGSGGPTTSGPRACNVASTQLSNATQLSTERIDVAAAGSANESASKGEIKIEPANRNLLPYPVTHVSFREAHDYCAFYGKRLPEAYEWQYVAQNGSWKNFYPWASVHTKQYDVSQVMPEEELNAEGLVPQRWSINDVGVLDAADAATFSPHDAAVPEDSLFFREEELLLQLESTKEKNENAFERDESNNMNPTEETKPSTTLEVNLLQLAAKERKPEQGPHDRAVIPIAPAVEQSEQGFTDLIGNVWQWTASEFSDEHTRATILVGSSRYQAHTMRRLEKFVSEDSSPSITSFPSTETDSSASRASGEKIDSTSSTKRTSSPAPPLADKNLMNIARGNVAEVQDETQPVQFADGQRQFAYDVDGKEIVDTMESPSGRIFFARLGDKSLLREADGINWYYRGFREAIVHQKYFLMSDSFERAGSIGFRCVRDALSELENATAGSFVSPSPSSSPVDRITRRHVDVSPKETTEEAADTVGILDPLNTKVYPEKSPLGKAQRMLGPLLLGVQQEMQNNAAASSAPTAARGAGGQARQLTGSSGLGAQHSMGYHENKAPDRTRSTTQNTNHELVFS
ncbi:unnamed protein product [Amoebophrya sp. A25]|nr:unnamed protein product [Amoebophrya sp. A25]|eukprot:GSA25T00002141001.1